MTKYPDPMKEYTEKYSGKTQKELSILNKGLYTALQYRNLLKLIPKAKTGSIKQKRFCYCGTEIFSYRKYCSLACAEASPTNERRYERMRQTKKSPMNYPGARESYRKATWDNPEWVKKFKDRKIPPRKKDTFVGFRKIFSEKNFEYPLMYQCKECLTWNKKNGQRIFCNNKCMGLFQSKRNFGIKRPEFSGPANPMWKDGQGRKPRPEQRRRGKAHRIYQWIYMDAHKMQEFPKGYDIHHVDGNRNNNELSNLQLMKREDHNKLHAEARRLGRRY